MNIVLESTQTIAAPAQKVWDVLTAFAAYEAWNPFIVRAQGVAQAGARPKLSMRQTSDGRVWTFSPVITRCEAPHELRWLGRLWLPGLFDGEHIFRLRETAQGHTQLTQQENFSGVLVRAFARRLQRDTQAAFARMNVALKARVEGHA